VLAPESEDDVGGEENLNIKLSSSISGVILIISVSSPIFSSSAALDAVQPGTPSANSLSSSNTIKLPSMTAA
jgi:hypothetical protein